MYVAFMLDTCFFAPHRVGDVLSLFDLLFADRDFLGKHSTFFNGDLLFVDWHPNRLTVIANAAIRRLAAHRTALDGDLFAGDRDLKRLLLLDHLLADADSAGLDGFLACLKLFFAQLQGVAVGHSPTGRLNASVMRGEFLSVAVTMRNLTAWMFVPGFLGHILSFPVQSWRGA